MRSILLALSFLAAALPSGAASFPWEAEWNTAFKTAKEQHRLVFVDYYAVWCAPCRLMDKTVFADAGIKQALEQFVVLRIDVDKSPIGRLRHVEALPTYVIYDPAERERFRVSGTKTVENFATALEGAQRSAPALVRAAELIGNNRPVEADVLVGNAYARLGMISDARLQYQEARTTAEQNQDRKMAETAEAMFDSTFAREGDVARSLKMLEELAQRTTDHDVSAFVFLTIGNIQRAALNEKEARTAFGKALLLAPADSAAHKEAALALARTH